MYGQIHCCVRSLILDKFGEETWKKIVEESEIDELKDFMVFHQYSDEPTERLFAAVATVAGLEVDVVLEVFGEYFLEYCFKHGYEKMMITMGGDFETFLQNLDSLHALLQLSYKNMAAPSFRAVAKDDGNIDLHYYSFRKGYHPLVIGLVREIGRRLFDCTVTARVIRRTEDISSMIEGVPGHTFKEYVLIELHIVHNNEPIESDGQTGKTKNSRRAPSAIVRKRPPTDTGRTNSHHLSQKVFCAVFPFHVLFDDKMNIIQTGDGLCRVCAVIANATRKGLALKMSDVFTLEHPMMAFTYPNIVNFKNAVFLVQIKPGPGSSALLLKGQMVIEPSMHKLLFIGSPRISCLTDLLKHNIYLSDIPVYDVTRELVLLNQQRIAEIEVSKKLDETTAELKQMAIELEKEKAKTENLLSEMLPKKVSDQLMQGKHVEAEKFGDVTIFFSDIVTFTNIAAASSPMDIVNMLNSLYEKFDELSSIHDVYKVETIGDAYMVVCGVPEPSEDHAVRVADFALGAIKAAHQVMAPATGKPLQIRVGLHTGPVVAGVVGVRMPRYCLFGDTVNTASRMESHGVPECIHCSPCTYRYLQEVETKYKFTPRGENYIKGKGLMQTYFLTSNGVLDIGEVPEEAFEVLTAPPDDDKAQPNVNYGEGQPSEYYGDAEPTEDSGDVTAPSDSLQLVSSQSTSKSDETSDKIIDNGDKTELSGGILSSEPNIVEMRSNRVSRACVLF